MATRITDWRTIVPHDRYLADLRVRHERKTALWKVFRQEAVD